MEHITRNLEETYGIAKRFVEDLINKNSDTSHLFKKQATVVGLFGNLGSGKTSFTQGVAKAFKIRDHITSPTFVLEKIYKLSKDSSYEHLIHIDAYRLEDAKEMSALGWDEVVRDPRNIIFIEWPERVSAVLPKEMIKIFFEAGDTENERKIKILC